MHDNLAKKDTNEIFPLNSVQYRVVSPIFIPVI